MYKIHDEIIEFITESMKRQKVELIVGVIALAGVKIQRGIFKGDALLPLLFLITMMPLNDILRKCREGYKFTK